MRLRNNITPKNSSQMVLSGRDNMLHPNLKSGVIAGDGNIIGNGENIVTLGSSGNIIGDGCNNIVLINSFDCEVQPGFSNVTLNNSSGVIVSSGDISYTGNAYKFTSELQQDSGNTATIYSKSVDISASELNNIYSSPKDLFDSCPSGYYINIISAQAKIVSDASATFDANDIIITGGTLGVNRMLTFGQLLDGTPLLSKICSSEKILTEPLGSYKSGQIPQLTIEGVSNPSISGNSTLKIYLTYEYILE